MIVIEGALLSGKPVMSLVSGDYYVASLPSLKAFLVSVNHIKYCSTLSKKGF
jgi:hypothetical protein